MMRSIVIPQQVIMMARIGHIGQPPSWNASASSFSADIGLLQDWCRCDLDRHSRRSAIRKTSAAIGDRDHDPVAKRPKPGQNATAAVLDRAFHSDYKKTEPGAEFGVHPN